MNPLLLFSRMLEKYMAAFVILFSALALYFPEYFVWVQLNWIPSLLMIVMFCMGLTQTADNFILILKQPKDIAVGCAAQYIIMPLLAFFLVKLFALNEALVAGVILVGCCPGGTASNVMTYLGKGDVPFSIGMTCASTLLSPIVTPCLTWLFLHRYLDVDPISMFISIVQVVLLPIVVGVFITSRFKNTVEKIVPCLPMVSIITLILILIAVIAHSSQLIRSLEWTIFIIVIMQNCFGYILGYFLAFLLKMPIAKRKALSIEVGMQNSALAVNLAAVNFSMYPLATVPGAAFSICHQVTGALLANFFSKRK